MNFATIKARMDSELKEKIKNREDLIRACHPDLDNIFSHDDCPACQKLIERIETIVKKENKEFSVVFEELYGRKK